MMHIDLTEKFVHLVKNPLSVAKNSYLLALIFDDC